VFGDEERAQAKNDGQIFVEGVQAMAPAFDAACESWPIGSGMKIHFDLSIETPHAEGGE